MRWKILHCEATRRHRQGLALHYLLGVINDGLGGQFFLRNFLGPLQGLGIELEQGLLMAKGNDIVVMCPLSAVNGGVSFAHVRLTAL